MKSGIRYLLNNKLILYYNYKGYKKAAGRKLPVDTIRLSNRLKEEIAEKG